MRQFIQTAKQNRNTLSQTPTCDGAGRYRQGQPGAPGPLLASQVLSNQSIQHLLHARVVQAKLNINIPGDKYEQEADRVAEKVMSVRGSGTGENVGVRRRSSESAVQRMCSGCEEEEKILQAKEIPGHRVSETIQGQSPLNRLRDGGQPLSTSEREFFEPRFGQDFSQVRIHSDAHAAESARALKARAYTRGRDIIFSAGEYAPSTIEGGRLVAHELTHVVQQRGGRAKRIQRKVDGGPGTSRYEELVSTATTSSQTPGVWEGEVTRQEFGKNDQLIQKGTAPVRYDENRCQVTVPVRVSFRHPTLDDLAQCLPDLDQPPPSRLPPPLKDSSFRSLADQYIREVNRQLNDWYNVRLAGCEKNPCYGREIPIRVEVAEAASGSGVDYEVALANLEGRSCVSQDLSRRPGLMVLYSQGMSSATMAHESGHMILGHGDEYRETSKQKRPQARVREGDWSLMSRSRAFGNWSLLHERHFAFVPAFLNKVRPGCQAGLREITRPTSVTLGVTTEIGYAHYAGGGALQFGLGLHVGLLPDRLRQWQIALGLHGQMLAGLDANARTAFLLGMRLSLDRTYTPSAGGFKLGGFAEAGGGRFGGGGRGRSLTGQYVELGVLVGYGLAPTSGTVLPFIGAELAVGTRIDTSDPQTERWFRAGLAAGFRFH